MYVELMDAARLAGVPSLTIHQKLTQGILPSSKDRQGKETVHTDDLRRVFGTLHALHPSHKYQCLCSLCLCARQTTPQAADKKATTEH